jgi:hypothetical protein
VKEGALFLTDIYESGLNPGKHRFDSSQVDVTDRAAVIGTIHQQFDQPIIFQDGHAGFALASIDQDFTLQVRPQPPAGCGTENALVGGPAHHRTRSMPRERVSWR